MTPLVDVLADPAGRAAVVRDAAALIEAEVAAKRGLRGAALKAGFKAFKAIQPGIIERAVDRLLPRFAPAVDPFWADASRTADPVAWLIERDGRIADALLAVTDRMAEGARNRVMVRIYKTLRGQARRHVLAAVPALARLILEHAG